MKINKYKSREEAVAYLNWYFNDDDGSADINAVNAFRYLNEPVRYKIKMDGKYCGNCDHHIKYDYIYCPYCGRVIQCHSFQ